MRTTIICLSLLAAVSAQGLGSLSGSCVAAATQLIGQPFAQCVNLVGLISLATNSGDLVPAVDSWISGLCSADPCSSDTLNTARSTLRGGCASDSNAQLVTTAYSVISGYSDVRAMLCTRYTSNGTYCVPQLLGSVQNSTNNQLTTDTLFNLLSPDGLDGYLDSARSNDLCTDCGKALVVRGREFAQSAAPSASYAQGIRTQAIAKCGDSFGDDTIPSTVQEANGAASQAAGTAAPDSGSGGSSGASQIGLSSFLVAGSLTMAGLVLGTLRIVF